MWDVFESQSWSTFVVLYIYDILIWYDILYIYILIYYI